MSDITETIKESYDDMLSTNPFASLLSEGNYASLQDENYNVNLLLFQALIKDFVIQQTPYFLVPPYEVSSITGTVSNARKRHKGSTTKSKPVTAIKDLSRRTTLEQRENATNSGRKLETPGDETVVRKRGTLSEAYTTGASSTSSTTLKTSTSSKSAPSTDMFQHYPATFHSSMKTAEEKDNTDRRKKKEQGTN